MGQQHTQEKQNYHIRGGMIPNFKWFCKCFWRKSWFKVFEITMELNCILKNVKSWFSHKNTLKLTKGCKPNPLKCGNSASFGMFWTYIIILFWLNSQLQMFSFCPIVKSMVSHCNKKTCCLGWVYKNIFIWDVLLPYDHILCLPYWVSTNSKFGIFCPGYRTVTFGVQAGVEFSIADISGDDLMGQREALAGQGIQVLWTSCQRHKLIKYSLKTWDSGTLPGTICSNN